MRLGGFDLSLLEGASQVLMSPGVSLEEPIAAQARARGIEVLGDIELFARAVRAPVIGITGTNGKSTVTSLVAHMAATAGRRVLAGGNLGDPALDLLEQPIPDLYVLELSSFQLETTRSLELKACGGAQRHAGSHGPLCHARRLRARQGAHLRQGRDDRAERRRSAGVRDADRSAQFRGAHRDLFGCGARTRISACCAATARPGSRCAARRSSMSRA